MTVRRWMRKYLVGVIAIIVSVVVFLVPFLFVVLEAAKNPKEAGLVTFSWPTEWLFFQNLVEVLQKNDYQVLWAFLNSAVLTIASCTIMVVLAAMVGYILQRKRSRLQPARQLPRARRAHRAARGGPHHLGAAGHRTVQDPPRHDPHRGHVRARVLRAALPRLRRHASRRSSTKPRSSTAPGRSDCSSGSCCRCCDPSSSR